MTTTIFSKLKRIHLAYSTVCGEYHKKERERNQDAVAAVKKARYTAVCAADGVGSQRYSRFGSRAVVKAVVMAFDDFTLGRIGKKEITATILKRYKKLLRQKYRAAASTTCIFVVITAEYGMFVGQAGDGLCFVQINGKTVFGSRKDDEFLNDVQAISASRENAIWKTKHFNLADGDVVEIMLATDGVSEDIVSNKERECLDYFLRNMGGSVGCKVNKNLKKCLMHWGDTGSNDDKTVVVYKGEIKSE